MTRTGGAICILALVAASGMLGPSVGQAQWLELSVPDRPEPEAVNVEAGREIYERRCWFCHGDEGDGAGAVADDLWPRPRDFTMASYKLRTTESGELPTDEDLYRTISLGMPGSAMPEWQTVLTAQQRWDVIAYLKSFADGLFEDEAFDPYRSIIEIGTGPDGDADSLIAAGRRIFDEADCWECHGALGRGDGERAAELTDDWDFPLWPTNLHLGWKFRGGNTAREIYLRLSSGLDGTPMPSYAETLTDEERWQVAHYIASFFTPERNPSTGVVITARLVDGAVPSDPDDPVWEMAPELSIPLSGQATFAPRWQVPAVTDLAVRAVYNAEEVALRLVWGDRFADTLSTDSAEALAAGWDAGNTFPAIYPDGERVRGMYPDAVEVMFPVHYDGGPVLPHFVYGSSGQPVDLWRWRADLQRNGDSLSAVMELRGSGAQRPPEAHAPGSQQATGLGMWQDGQWAVVVRRPLQTEQGTREVQFEPGQLVPVGFHVWEGANGETGLKMALSSWYFIHLRQPASAVNYLVVLLVVISGGVLEYAVVRWTSHRARQGGLTRFGV